MWETRETQKLFRFRKEPVVRKKGGLWFVKAWETREEKGGLEEGLLNGWVNLGRVTLSLLVKVKGAFF